MPGSPPICLSVVSIPFHPRMSHRLPYLIQRSPGSRPLLPYGIADVACLATLCRFQGLWLLFRSRKNHLQTSSAYTTAERATSVGVGVGCEPATGTDHQCTLGARWLGGPARLSQRVQRSRTLMLALSPCGLRGRLVAASHAPSGSTPSNGHPSSDGPPPVRHLNRG